MPTFPLAAWREIRAHDVVNVHLPQVEAALGTLLAWIAGPQILVTYHCDLEMPPVWYGRLVDRLTSWDNLVACKLADTIVTNTEEFARHSPVLARFGLMECGHRQGAGCGSADPDRPALRREAGRHFATNSIWPRDSRWLASWDASRKKGVDYLINAIPRVAARIPDVHFVFAGPKDAVGETTWHDLHR